MKTRLMLLTLMAGGALFAQTHVAIGDQIGRPAPVVVPAPVPVAAYRPPCPGPGYVWIAGYYDEFGDWYDGYWTLPPYVGAYWVAPRLFGGHFYAGYWRGPRGIYRVAPRFAPPVYGRGHERGFDRNMRERYDRGFRGRGGDREHGRGGDRRR